MDRYVLRVPRTDSGQRMNQQQFLPHLAAGRIVADSPYPYYGSEYNGRCNPGAPPAMSAYPFHSPPQGYVQQAPGFASQSPYIADNSGVQQPYIHGGIDPGYLAAYNTNTSLIYPGQMIPLQARELVPSPAASGSRHSLGARYAPATPAPGPAPSTSNMGVEYRNDELAKPERGSVSLKKTAPSIIIKKDKEVDTKAGAGPFKSRAEPGKDDIKNSSRADKQKALYRSGVRVFSGTVENVLKWHRALHDIGVVCFYEIVARCVSVRQGEGEGGSCAKQLVVRDDGGPAMQMLYYETDFLLPSLPPNCTLRAVGKMVCGRSQLQAYVVRAATGDDVAALPRRAAVAAHHVAKLAQAHAPH